jgi:hypothetical protein
MFSLPHVALAVLLTGAPAAGSGDGPGTGHRKTDDAAGSVSPTSQALGRPAGKEIAPSRLEEARSSLPLPLLYGTMSLKEGQYVDYEVKGPRGKTRVRAAAVGRALRDNVPVQQVEFEFFDLGRRALVVLWITESQPVLLDRVAAWAPPHTPVSVPIDLPVDDPQLRGVQASSEAVKVTGAFAGQARRVVFSLESKERVEATLSEQVPLFGVLSVQRGDERWTAVASGTGAKRALTRVPLAMPRAQEL